MDGRTWSAAGESVAGASLTWACFFMCLFIGFEACTEALTVSGWSSPVSPPGRRLFAPGCWCLRVGVGTSSLARWTMLPAESTASPAIGCSAFRRGVHDVLSKRRRAMVGAALFPSGWRPPDEGGEAKDFAPPLLGVAAPPARRCILRLLNDGVRRSAPPPGSRAAGGRSAGVGRQLSSHPR